LPAQAIDAVVFGQTSTPSGWISSVREQKAEDFSDDENEERSEYACIFP
jgi:hypothetical protein